MANNFFIKKLDDSGTSDINLRCLGKVGDFLYWTPTENVLLKTDINFNPIWQKEISGLTGFHGVHPTSTGDDIIIRGTINDSESSIRNLVLANITASGNLTWIKKYESGISGECFISSLPPKPAFGEIPETSSGGYVVAGNDQVFTIDEKGDVTDSKTVKGSTTVSGVAVYDNQIYIIGDTLEESSITSTSIVVLSLSLDFIKGSKFTIGNEPSYASGKQYVSKFGSNLFISKNIWDKKVVCSFDMTSMQVTSSVKFNKSWEGARNGIFSDADGLYVFGRQSNKTILYKLSDNLFIKWVKEIKGLLIWEQDFNAFDEFLMITQGSTTSTWDKNTVIKTGSNLESICISAITESDFTEIAAFSSSNYTPVLNNLSITVAVPSVTLSESPLYPVLQLCPSVPSIYQSTITANPERIGSDGTSTATITVQLKDSSGANITTGGETVLITTSTGTISPTTDQGNGTYTAELTSSTEPSNAVLTFTLNGEIATNTAAVIFEEAVPEPEINLKRSSITSRPIMITANGTSTSTVTVQLKDASGENITKGGESVVITTSKGTLSAVTDQGSGKYTALLTSSVDPGIAELTFRVNTEPAPKASFVLFRDPKIEQEPAEEIIQSSHLYLQAAGSTGSDGTATGIHLRWLLKGYLINHLPKGNLAGSAVNYNKPDDYVTVYRAPYTPDPLTVNLLNPPRTEIRKKTLWLYLIGENLFYLYFQNKTRYKTVRETYDPLTQPSEFLENYGAEILELRTSSDLFFAARLISSSTAVEAKVESEIYSVEGKDLNRKKQLTVRKTFAADGLSNAQLGTENGKSLQFRATNCQVTAIEIELYGPLSDRMENGPGWTQLGQFALSEDDTEVFNRLEPTDGLIDGVWPRYNDGALVNLQNYKDKWNQLHPSTQSSIKQTVQDYISLSDAMDNPMALETVRFSNELPPGVTEEEDNSFELSNLLLLQQAAMDYHIARMLGLGHLDIGSEVQGSASFVYMAVYRTAGNTIDGQSVAKITEHRYITAPTSRTDEKLPEALDLHPPVPGLFLANGNGETAESLTGEDGYTQDGKARFITLYAKEPFELSQPKGFYSTETDFNLTLGTSPVFAGVEYKKSGETSWRRPELANTPDYHNSASNGETPINETVALPVPDVGTPLFVHKETSSGEHIYSSYGINWFSRIKRSNQEYSIDTTIEPTNTLLPPGDRSALLVVEEQPILLTTANEQLLLADITDDDKTLVRLMFNYYSSQELMSYRITEKSLGGATDPLDPEAVFPDSQEVFADAIEIYFRDSMPLNVSGKAIQVADHPANDILAILTTSGYKLDSTGQTISPAIPTEKMSNFVGGVLLLEGKEYIIHEVSGNANAPTFTVYKKQISDKLQKGAAPDPSEALSSPEIKADGMFLAVENLQNTSSWGSPNPHPLTVQVGDNWPVHREVISRMNPDGQEEKYLQKTRGVWDFATIERILQPKAVEYDPETGAPTVTATEHRGQYKATFSSTSLAHHPQSTGENPVEWYKGIIRVHTEDNPFGERRDLEIIKIENIGNSEALTVYFADKGFTTDHSYNEIQTGESVEVNFYPGYRIYLYANPSAGITKERILPETGQGIRYSCFGFRSVNNSYAYYSRIAVPTVLFAQEIITPLEPNLSTGTAHATRPDSFGKATYSLATQFNHSPHGVLYYRADDRAVLRAIYTSSTAENVKRVLAETDRASQINCWQNLLGFDYEYPNDSYQTDALFGVYPETAEGYRLPNPDNPQLFATDETPGSILPGDIVERIKVAILSTFVPLTEIPLLYSYIRDGEYEPIPKKQVVRDRNGALLLPSDPAFDLTPMVKKEGENLVRFVDFTLDGTSDNVYFYAVKELSNTSQMSSFSPILGPVYLVNTNPPRKPAIRQVTPSSENITQGTFAQMEVAINTYSKSENIKKISLYRTLSPAASLSIRSMDLVSDQTGLGGNLWVITDDFGDLTDVPYGDPIYYRVAVSREINYPEKDDPETLLTEYVTSEPSKIMVTTLVESRPPVAPVLAYTADPVNESGELTQVVLSWEKTGYKSKYTLYKLSNQGQWLEIHELTTNEQFVNVPLELTSLGSNTLTVVDGDGQRIVHHFKLSVENSAGLSSREDSLLSIP